MTERPECPGCGIPDLVGPYEAPEGSYYECHSCERHVFADEIGAEPRVDPNGVVK